MAKNTTVLCYINGEIIDYEYGAYYNRPLEKSVSINNMITFDELLSKLCFALKYYSCLHQVKYDISISDSISI